MADMTFVCQNVCWKALSNASRHMVVQSVRNEMENCYGQNRPVVRVSLHNCSPICQLQTSSWIHNQPFAGITQLGARE